MLNYNGQMQGWHSLILNQTVQHWAKMKRIQYGFLGYTSRILTTSTEISILKMWSEFTKIRVMSRFFRIGLICTMQSFIVGSITYWSWNLKRGNKLQMHVLQILFFGWLLSCIGDEWSRAKIWILVKIKTQACAPI